LQKLVQRNGMAVFVDFLAVSIRQGTKETPNLMTLQAPYFQTVTVPQSVHSLVAKPILL